jgi:hypothetical protein
MPYTDLGEPRSRNERILMNMLGAEYDIDDPQSRIEYLLKLIYEEGGTSGAVSGVKGALEEAFRKGNVDLSLDQITKLDNGLMYDAVLKTLRGIQYDVIPTPASTYKDKTIQYTGMTTAQYKTAHFYKCVEKDGSLVWEDQTDIDSLTQEQMDALLAILP